MKPLSVEVVAYAPTEFFHCGHCEVVWREAGVGQKVHAEQRRSALPDDLRQDYEAVSRGLHDLVERFGERVAVNVVDAASLEGFFKSLRHNLHRYPAFIVGGKRRYTGIDMGMLAGLVEEALAASARATLPAGGKAM